MTHSKMRRGWLVLAAGAVTVLTVLVHWPAVHNGFVYWDDPLYLGRVSQFGRVSLSAIAWAATALLPLYYHPLTWLSHLVDFQLWGWNPAGHHATSVLLHGMNAGLVCLLVWKLTGRVEELSDSTRLAMAGVVAVVFGIHPLQVESVAWVAERKTVLCAFFSLLCLCAYIQAVADPQRSKPTRPWWWWMHGLFLAALLSKPMAVSLPVVMLALDFYPLRRPRLSNWWVLVKEKWVLFTGCVVMGVMTIVSQSRAGAVTNLAGLDATARGHLLRVEAGLAGVVVPVLSAGRKDSVGRSGICGPGHRRHLHHCARVLAAPASAGRLGRVVRLPRVGGARVWSVAGRRPGSR
jgi:hypothetical protein